MRSGKHLEAPRRFSELLQHQRELTSSRTRTGSQRLWGGDQQQWPPGLCQEAQGDQWGEFPEEAPLCVSLDLLEGEGGGGEGRRTGAAAIVRS